MPVETAASGVAPWPWLGLNGWMGDRGIFADGKGPRASMSKWPMAKKDQETKKDEEQAPRRITRIFYFHYAEAMAAGDILIIRLEPRS